MLALPSHMRRAWQRAFWLALSLWAGVAVGALVPVSLWGRGTAALLTALLLQAAGAAWPGGVTLAYRAWNRVAREYARVVRAALVAACYGVVVVVGAAGSTLRLRRPAPGVSLWYPKASLPLAAYGSQHEGPGPHAGRWRSLLAWALSTGHAWVIPLLPFLVLLGTLDRQEAGPPPAGIYTLF